MENESTYSIKKAQYSLDIGDHMNIDNQWLINRIKILESRASQFESTLKETMKVRDELDEKLNIATEALKHVNAFRANEYDWTEEMEEMFYIAHEALDKLKKGLEA